MDEENVPMEFIQGLIMLMMQVVIFVMNDDRKGYKNLIDNWIKSVSKERRIKIEDFDEKIERFAIETYDRIMKDEEPDGEVISNIFPELKGCYKKKIGPDDDMLV